MTTEEQYDAEADYIDTTLFIKKKPKGENKEDDTTTKGM
jgi:hypothetical protein|tara:strand:- start:2624 stop:2740 length:117 start_codon:yes stop_codon:yes gene_type:complete